MVRVDTLRRDVQRYAPIFFHSRVSFVDSHPTSQLNVESMMLKDLPRIYQKLVNEQRGRVDVCTPFTLMWSDVGIVLPGSEFDQAATLPITGKVRKEGEVEYVDFEVERQSGTLQRGRDISVSADPTEGVVESINIEVPELKLCDRGLVWIRTGKRPTLTFSIDQKTSNVPALVINHMKAYQAGVRTIQKILDNGK